MKKSLAHDQLKVLVFPIVIVTSGAYEGGEGASIYISDVLGKVH